MDNLTHSLVGLMMSRAGIDRRVVRAAPLMILAANIPDLDVISLAGGGLSYLEWHRSYAHALVFAPAMALIPLAAMLAFRVRPTWLAYAASLLGVLSHLALDWTNAYGVRLLLPFSPRWLRLDQTEVIDPWIWALLLAAVAAPALARIVGSEISSKKIAGPRRGWAWFALSAMLLYEGGRAAGHERALAVMGAHLYNGSVATRILATPGGLNPWRWRGIVEGPGFVDLLPVDLDDEFDPLAGRVEYPAEPGPRIDAARATRPFQVFEKFAQAPFWKTTPVAGGTLVELIDLRFGTPQSPGFEARAVVDSSGIARDARFTFTGR